MTDRAPTYSLGDDFYDSSTTNGPNVETFEIAEVVTADGDIDPWITQNFDVSPGHTSHGLGALLYFNYLFYFEAVATETLGEWPSAAGSSSSRLEYNEEAADMADILDNYQSVNQSFNDERAYYVKMVRINGHLYAIGGADDSIGVLNTIEAAPQ